MFREYIATKYVSSKLSIVPKVLEFNPRRRELITSYIPGQRMLEWVLQRFGEPNLSLAQFQSIHGLDPGHYVDPRVAQAFTVFRESRSEEALRVKQAIRSSYALLHQIGFLHSSADPRNLIYDGERVFIIDFDHARPSFNPASLDYQALTYWYGLQPADLDSAL
jgi:hypothetical protein